MYAAICSNSGVYYLGGTPEFVEKNKKQNERDKRVETSLVEQPIARAQSDVRSPIRVPHRGYREYCYDRSCGPRGKKPTYAKSERASIRTSAWSDHA